MTWVTPGRVIDDDRKLVGEQGVLAAHDEVTYIGPWHSLRAEESIVEDSRPRGRASAQLGPGCLGKVRPRQRPNTPVKDLRAHTQG